MSEGTRSIWEYIHGYAPKSDPAQITFFDHNDNTLYRDVSLRTIGQHGWELVNAIWQPQENRYEYFFKRDQTCGYDPGMSNAPQN